jgi:hypothetical protein
VVVDIQVVVAVVEEMVAGKEIESCSLVAWTGVWTMINFALSLKSAVPLNRPK